MNVSGFDVIYKERVYKCIDMHLCFPHAALPPDGTIDTPKLLNVTCINEDGNVIILNDETAMFRFIRKGRESNG